MYTVKNNTNTKQNTPHGNFEPFETKTYQQNNKGNIDSIPLKFFSESPQFIVTGGVDEEQGSKGDKGDQGDQGDKGDKGDQGDTGPAGIGAVSQETSGRALVAGDNGNSLNCSAAPGTTYTFTVPSGLPVPFICIFDNKDGTIVVNADGGVTVTDARRAGNAAPNACVLMSNGTNSYRLYGGKA